MKILFVSSECAPFSKSGGLADVAFSLPPALNADGEDAEVITPLYRCVREHYGNILKEVQSFEVFVGGCMYYGRLWQGKSGLVTVWFIENDTFFDRPKLYGYPDDALRFAFFCRAVVELLGKALPLPQILHCNDWECAAAVVYLKDAARRQLEFSNVKAVYTIHNIAYQGQFGRKALSDVFGLQESWYDNGLAYLCEERQDINLMKGAMLLADAVTTVSPTYARELHTSRYAHGLEGVVTLIDGKMYGILNGIDMRHYNPSDDPVLPASFSAEDMRGKATCKCELQKAFHLTEEAEWPLFAVAARLTAQKGMDLIRQILPQLMNLGIQLIIFGQGDREYADYFRWAAGQWSGQMGFSDDYNEETAKKVFAGADFYLMPSQFEPCGLSQMMAMRYGTIPVVRETGGLKDSVRPYSEFDGAGDGFSFSEYSAGEFYLAVMDAVKIYFADAETFWILRRRCMKKDFSWKKSAEKYEKMYREIAASGTDGRITFEEAFSQIKCAYEQIDSRNREKHSDRIRKEYHCVVQITIMGPGAGTLYVCFRNGGFQVEPYDYHDADAFVQCGLEQLLRMVRGEVSMGKLYMSGQLKIQGNLSKGFEIKHLLTPEDRKNRMKEDNSSD
jgi:starch synthase